MKSIKKQNSNDIVNIISKISIEKEIPYMQFTDIKINMLDVMSEVSHIGIVDTWHCNEKVEKIMEAENLNFNMIPMALNQKIFNDLKELGMGSEKLAFYGCFLDKTYSAENIMSIYYLREFTSEVAEFGKKIAEYSKYYSKNAGKIKLRVEQIMSQLVTGRKIINRNLALRLVCEVLLIAWFSGKINNRLELSIYENVIDENISFRTMVGYIAEDNIVEDILAVFNNTFDFQKENEKYVDRFNELSYTGTKVISDFVYNRSSIYTFIFLEDFIIEKIKNEINKSTEIEFGILDEESIIREKIYTKNMSVSILDIWIISYIRALTTADSIRYNLGLSEIMWHFALVKIREKNKELEGKVEALKNYKIDIDSSYKEFKSELKRKKKELEKKELELRICQSEGRKLKEKYIELENSKGSKEAYEYEIDSLNKLTEEYKTALKQKSMAFNKVVNAAEKMLNENNQLKRELKAANEKISNIGKPVVQATMDEVRSNAVVNAIRNVRVTIYGGNMMFSQLKNLGFQNMTLVDANEKGVANQDIMHKDLIVIVTSYISHSLSNQAKAVARTCGVKVTHFNGKNVETLCRRIFNEVYGE